MASIPPSSNAMTEDDNASRRGEDEAEEEGAPAGRAAGQKRAGGKNRVRINRDQGDVPPVRDDTGEKVTELFQQFLEQ